MNQKKNPKKLMKPRECLSQIEFLQCGLHNRILHSTEHQLDVFSICSSCKMRANEMNAKEGEKERVRTEKLKGYGKLEKQSKWNSPKNMQQQPN